MQRHSCPGAGESLCLRRRPALRAPLFITKGLPPLLLYFKEVKAVHVGRIGRERHRGEWGGGGVVAFTETAYVRQDRRRKDGTPGRAALCLGCFKAKAPSGPRKGEGRWGRESKGRAPGWGGGGGGAGKGGFTTLKRVGIPPEPFPHLAGSCENNSLAFTLLVSLFLSCSLALVFCSDEVPAMSQLCEQKVWKGVA